MLRLSMNYVNCKGNKMAEIKRATMMTADEAFREKEKAIREGRYQEAMILGDLVNLLVQAEIYQNNERMMLSNPRSMARSEKFCKIWQMVEDFSYEAVPEPLRNQIKQLETKLQGQSDNG